MSKRSLRRPPQASRHDALPVDIVGALATALKPLQSPRLDTIKDALTRKIERRQALSRVETRLRPLVASGTPRPAIAYLNSLTEYRFTAMYRFDDEILRNLCFFDRDDPAQEVTPDIRVDSSYCDLVRRSGAAVTIEDSALDARVRNHPKRAAVRAYVGSPLKTAQGEVFGTLCHFDTQPRRLDAAHVQTMEMAGPLLAQASRGRPSWVCA